MTEDEKQTSEDIQPEDNDSDGSAAGPVAGEDTSSSQAAGEEPTPTPPADETSDAEQPQDETSEAEQPQDGPPAEESDADPVAEQPEAAAEVAGTSDEVAEGADQGSQGDGAPAGDSGSEAEQSPDDEVAEGADQGSQGDGAPAGDSGSEAEQSPDDEVAEGADQGSQGDGAPAGDGGSEAEQSPEKKKDVIPGADLEPIAVEPEAELSAEERARQEAEEEERARREAALTGDEEETSAATRAPAKMESGARYLATGKRKSSIARVILTPGSGKIEVNQRALEEFFPRPLHQTTARQPLTTTGYEGSVDVRVRVNGGGISGQAGAVRHGIARALTEIDPQLRGELKRRGFLTRDARVKERRKAGLKKARKRPQFSKR